ncbi:MAG: hypothetical protein R3C24_13665 [Cyanobacteriota/Melainabacteria group bacterium]
MLSNFEKSPFSTFVYSIASLKEIGGIQKQENEKEKRKKKRHPAFKN